MWIHFKKHWVISGLILFLGSCLAGGTIFFIKYSADYNSVMSANISSAVIDTVNLEKTTATLQSYVSGKLEISVLDSTNILIKSLYKTSGIVNPTTVSQTWDGKNSAGATVVSGNYNIRFTVYNKKNRILGTISKPITVTSGEIQPATTLNSIQTIINDMTLSHDAYPHGVPSDWNWYKGPEINMGNNPVKNGVTFTAMTTWGQIYVPVSPINTASNTRVNIRNIQAYYLSVSDKSWHRLQYSKAVDGDAYVEDFSHDSNITANKRMEPDGTLSAKLTPGYNFHFWFAGDRAVLPPKGDIAAIYTSGQARLIIDNPNLKDDRSSAKYIMNMGGDYWLSQTAEWAENQAHNDDIGMGRFKFVTNDWQPFSMTTATADQLKGLPLE